MEENPSADAQPFIHPTGALAPEAEKSLLTELTDVLITHYEADPSNENVKVDRLGVPASARRRSSSEARSPRRHAIGSSPRFPRASSTPSGARPWSRASQPPSSMRRTADMTATPVGSGFSPRRFQTAPGVVRARSSPCGYRRVRHRRPRARAPLRGGAPRDAAVGRARGMNPLAEFVLQDENGGEVALSELWSERSGALVFLRHYLCVQCRVGSMELERDRDRLPPEPNLWLVGMGTPVQARAFRSKPACAFPCCSPQT